MSDNEINARYNESQWAIEPADLHDDDNLTDEEWWTS
jgi:uncharacterized sporulation protein YeaH/YhbH (DUF444 family)